MPEVRPNILFIFPDQWRGDCLGSLGHPVVETPYLDELASQGVTFTRAYSNCPSCIAARASLMTGLTPNSTGRLGYRDGVTWLYPDTLPRLLRDGGYQTINVGKTHFHPQRAHLGFEINEIYDTQKTDPWFEADYDRWLKEKTKGQIVDTTVDMNSNSWLVQPWVHPEHLHPTCWTSSRSIELLERRDPLRPFFMMLSYHRPHPPIDPPLSWYQRFMNKALPPAPAGDWVHELPGMNDPVVDLQAYHGQLTAAQLDTMRRAYYAQIAHLDFQIGRVIWWLQKYGKCLQNTWIVFASDHGELLGDHNLLRKFNGFEGSARVPMIVRPPTTPAYRDIRRHQCCDQPVGLHDFLPTMLDMAELSSMIPQKVEGQSLLPLLRGENVSSWRAFIHGEHSQSRVPGGGWQFVVSRRWKFIWQTGSGREFLFDLQYDPDELHNLIRSTNTEHQAALQQCRAAMIEVLRQRPDDKLTDGNQLTPGNNLPPVRNWLLEQVGLKH